MQFERFVDNEGVNVRETNSQYRLVICTKDIAGMGNVFFYYPSPCKIVPSEITVSGRNYEQYIKELKVPINPELQYIEVGIGLGGFLPQLIENFGNKLRYKPIAIDPVNYQILKSILDYTMQSEKLNDEHTTVMSKFLRRIQIITDPNKLMLINTSLGRALELYPELKGLADVVVSLAGPGLHSETELKKGDRGQDLGRTLKERVKFLENELRRIKL